MPNSIYDPRVEPHFNVIVVDDESRERLGVMEAIVNMTSTLGNHVISITEGGIKLCKPASDREYFVQEAEIFKSEAERFGFCKAPAQIADALIEGINNCPHLNALDRYERHWRDLWRRLNQFPTEIQPPGFTSIKYTEYDRVMAGYAERKRRLESGREADK